MDEEGSYWLGGNMITDSVASFEETWTPGTGLYTYSYDCDSNCSWAIQMLSVSEDASGACLPGYYIPAAYDYCIEADAGHHTPYEGMTEQLECELGTYQPDTGQSSCDDADEGHYVDANGSTTQTPCSTGTWQNLTGQASCTDASPGHYVNSSGSSSQHPCSPGSYQPDFSQTSCLDAMPGNYVSSNASIDQALCPQGTWQNQSGQSSCIEASAGHYTGGVEKISSSGSFACAIFTDDTMSCWGRNDHGQLGDGTVLTDYYHSAYWNPMIGDRLEFPDDRYPVDVTTGGGHACVILDNGSVNCWGWNSGHAGGAVGDGSFVDRSTPTYVDLGPGRTAVEISAGQWHTCALLDNQSISCWGSNAFGQLGDGNGGPTDLQDDNPCPNCDQDWNNQTSPVTVSFDGGIIPVSVSAGTYNTCAILENGSVMCWGRGVYGLNGDGAGNYDDDEYEPSSSPYPRVAPLEVGIGQWHACAIPDNPPLLLGIQHAPADRKRREGTHCLDH